MPYIAVKTGAKVFGTQSTANVARAEGVAEKQIRVVNPGEEMTLEGFTVKVIHSLHGIFRRPPPGAYTPPNPPLVPDGVKGPLRLASTSKVAPSPTCSASAVTRFWCLAP
jgi:L-ascorbate metabolism protein UlaG (beta-lactamase superfamily)